MISNEISQLMDSQPRNIMDIIDIYIYIHTIELSIQCGDVSMEQKQISRTFIRSDHEQLM